MFLNDGLTLSRVMQVTWHGRDIRILLHKRTSTLHYRVTVVLYAVLYAPLLITLISQLLGSCVTSAAADRDPHHKLATY